MSLYFFLKVQKAWGDHPSFFSVFQCSWSSCWHSWNLGRISIDDLKA